MNKNLVFQRELSSDVLSRVSCSWLSSYLSCFLPTIYLRISPPVLCRSSSLLGGGEEQPLQQLQCPLQEGCSPSTQIPGFFRCHFLDNPFAFTQGLLHQKPSMACFSRILSMTSVAMHQNILKQREVCQHHMCVHVLLLL